MSKKIVAHFTDAHLGQKLVLGPSIEDKMHYEDEPEEHHQNLRLVLADIARRGISDVIFGGDIGSKESMPRFFDLLRRYDFTSFFLLGNHDAYTDVVAYCRYPGNAAPGKMCFHRDDGFLKHFFLDTSDNSVGDNQLVWLKRHLVGTTRIALFLHHPVLAIDTPLERAGATLRDRDKLMALLTGLSCEVSVFCGHYHMEDDASSSNIRQFVTPAVSYQIVKHAEKVEVEAGKFGYRILEIDDGQIATEVVML